MWITRLVIIASNGTFQFNRLRGECMISFSVTSLLVLLLSSAVSFAKVNPPNQKNQSIKNSALSDQSLTEELTGKKEVRQVSFQNLKKAPLPQQHFAAGQKAAASKNYILAIKHFNTVIQNYPQSNQVSSALVAKAKVYQEMGLKPQADRNFKLAQLKTKQSVTKIVSHREQNKITK